ncbi:MAG TPA: autotransporter-associated beta strand repeat-containing protein [Verrucomicrobiae bacterium]|nr:autotransporter-associated beta strand repeat-containing protein [Verrucomicrobiae bacterium]
MKAASFLTKSKLGSLLLLAGTFAGLNSRAQSSDTWVGGSGNNFSTLANWTYSGGSGPVANNDSLSFDVTGSTTPNNDLVNLSLQSITYNSGAPSFTVGGNALTFPTAGNFITVNSTAAQTLNNNIILGNVAMVIYPAAGNLILGGVISGGGNTLTFPGGANVTLSGANTYSGTTALNAGNVLVGNALAFGASRVNIANSPAVIDLNGHNLSVAFINNQAALFGGTIDNVSAGGTVTLKVGSGVGGVSAASGTYTSIDSFSGIIRNTTGTVGLTKVAPALANQTAGIMASASLLNGPAVLRLMNANTYTGPTTINGGILELNFGQANNGGSAVVANIISPVSALVLAGGDLVVDEVGAAGAQTFAGSTLNAGASHLASYRNTSSAASIAMGGITRNTGSTLDFQSRPSGTSSNQKIGAADGTDTTTNVNANFVGGQQTILGGYATFNTYVSGGGGSWAVSGTTVNTAKTITGAPTLTAGFTASKDVDAAIGTSTPASMFINSLRFNTAGAYTVNTAGNITNATGGILETLTVGANAVAINNNVLTSGNGQDLIIHQYNTLGGMTIGANIVDGASPIGLTKSGPGALTLTPNAANTFSGQLTLNAGTVTLGNANALNGVPAVVFGGMSQTLGGAAPAFTFANGTLNLNGNNASVASLSVNTDSSGTALIQNANATPAILTVNGAATTSFTGTVQDGTGGGTLSLVKNGAGSQTIGGTLSYSGSTTVGAGTLLLTTPASATASYVVNGTLDATALTGSTLALVSPQTLGGGGTVSGSVTVASGAHTRPGAIGVTNTITGNLTYSSGAKADFDLNTSATSGPNDQVVLSGASSVLTGGGVAININLMGATLDTTHDYVLFRLTGGSASISGAFSSVPTWLGTVPANSGSYSIITDTVNKKVLLHYTLAAAPSIAATASPAVVVANQSTFISVTVTPGSGTVTNVYLDLSLINGSTPVPLTLSGTPNVYTNTIAIPASAPLGSVHVVANATDTTPLTGSGNIALTIYATNEVWNGASTGSANWSDNANWASIRAPGSTGDSLVFDGSTQLASSMDASYNVTALTFPSTAGAFVISAANGGVLTLSGGLTNSSASAQILSVPVVLATAQPINAATADITLGGAITGGNLTKVGNNTLHLSNGANTYTGSTVVSNGTITLDNGGSIGGGQITLANGALASGYISTTRLTLGNNISIPAGNTGTINMSALNRLNGAVTGAGILNINAPGGQDDIAGTWNTYAGQVNLLGGGTVRLFINSGSFNGFSAAAVTMTNVSLTVSDNSGGNTFGVGAFNEDSTATILGPFAGNSPNFVIGGLNQNDAIAGGVQGSVRITKVGSGNLTISSAGTATYTGPTILSNGTLTVLGQINASPLTNYSGATLTGNGTLFSADLELGSFISPGVAGYGTLACGSDLTFNGGTNVVDISTNNHDLITVSGNLNLVGGGIRLVPGTVLTNGTYQLITYAGTLTGSAGNLTLAGFSQSGQTAVLSDSTAGEIDLIVATSGGANLIWASAGAQNNIWNIVNSINWNNGASLTTFTPGDHATFNNAGAGNTTVDVRAIVQPSTTLVTGSQAYLFESTTGGGKLSGATNSLVVSGPGSLELDIASDYGGPTTISSGSTLTVGNGADSASIGTGMVTNNGTLVFNQTNNLSLTNIVGTGAGTLTKNGASTLTLTANNTYNWTAIGAGATVQVGAGGTTGSLGSGSVTNDGKLVYNKTGSFTVANINTGPANGGEVDFLGAGNVTFNNGNTYVNNTVVDGGVVKLNVNEAIPSAATVPSSTGWLVLDGSATTAGTLDLNGFNQTVNALSGLGSTTNGLITNSTASTISTNLLTVLGGAATTYSGTIADNSGGSKIALVLRGANQLELHGANSYSGGTIVGDTAILALHNGAGAGTGGILMSNGTTFRMNGAGTSGDPSIFPGNAVTIVDGASVAFTSQQAANGFGGTVVGGTTTTLVVGGGTSAQVSFSSGTAKEFQSMLGTVLIPSDGFFRWSANTANNGGDFTTFDVEGAMTSKIGVVSLGALTGAGSIDAGGSAGTIAYTIGLQNNDTTFSGTLRDGSVGIFSLTKAGTGKLTLSGTVTYTGNTTVNSGTLALLDPVSLDNSVTSTLGGSTATLDVSGRADDAVNLGNLKVQTLAGVGNIAGKLNELSGSFVRPGLGVMAISGSATLAGNIVMQLNRTNAIMHSEITAASYFISGPLTVTNAGPALQGGDSFQLFNTGVTGFSSVTLPALTGSMFWITNLAVNGSITVTNPVNTSPPPIRTVVSGTTLTLSWPTNSGWTLQMQTNAINKGLGTNWVDYIPGTTGITSTNITLDPTKPTVFFRLRL